jgi:prolyl-tRNA synthetase
MKLSELFNRTSGQLTESGQSVNHDLLVKAGFVDQLMAGAYSYLPLGLKVLRKIENIVREEMNAIGSQEILMPTLHPAAIWKTTGGWDNIDVLFKVKSRTKADYALGSSEEEVVTPLVMKHVLSYKDLPVSVYQIHWKYRDELRAKSGIMRGREFYMKDMYSFHATQADFDQYYNIAKQAYLKVYQRLGLVAKATEASGGSFTEKISYEFMVLTDAGEDDILYCSACDFCVNVEIAKQKAGDSCPKCDKDKLAAAKASEVGNVFDLGQKYGKDFDLQYIDESNQRHYPIMGCYGIGISRLMGVIVEKFHDERGIIWPTYVAPAQVHLIAIGESTKVKEEVELQYRKLQDLGIEVLYDDRSESPGSKLMDADLIGIPLRMVVSEKTLAKDSVEIKHRQEEEAKLVRIDKVAELFAKDI